MNYFNPIDKTIQTKEDVKIAEEVKKKNEIIFKKLGHRSIYYRLLQDKSFGSTAEEVYNAIYEDVIKIISIANVIDTI